jgi:hypothetical protein
MLKKRAAPENVGQKEQKPREEGEKVCETDFS